MNSKYEDPGIRESRKKDAWERNIQDDMLEFYVYFIVQTECQVYL